MADVKEGRERKRDPPSLEYDLLLPTCIFHDRRLSVLEVIVEFLKESHHLSYAEIGRLMNRDERNIWTVYRRANNKRAGQPITRPNSADTIYVPLSIFCDRRLSVLEVLINYLKANTPLTNHQIAITLSRDDKTVWTVISRGHKKLKHG